LEVGDPNHFQGVSGNPCCAPAEYRRHLKIGNTLIAAKKALPHGAFEKMVEDDLPFNPSTAQRLTNIARDPRIRKAAMALGIADRVLTIGELIEAALATQTIAFPVQPTARIVGAHSA